MWEFLVAGGLVYYLVTNYNANSEVDEEECRQQRDDTFELNTYSSSLSKKLQCVAENLGPSESYITTVCTIAKKIFEHLDETGSLYGLEVDDSQVAGSIGKRTCIIYKDENGDMVYPDLDLVIYLSNKESSYNNELKLFARLLKNLNEVSDIIIRKFSVELKFGTPKGNIKVDLLAAHRLADTYIFPWWGDAHAGEIDTLDVIQREALYQTQSVNQDENKRFSRITANTTVSIIAGLVEDEYFLKVVRLAKYWNSSLDMSQCRYVPARSCVIELIAIHAQKPWAMNNAEDQGERCIVSGFRRFLEHVAEFQTLDISLDDEAPNLENYDLPMIRDPVNGWNNLAQGIPDEAIQIWQEDAKLKLSQLEKLRNRSDTNYNVEYCLFNRIM